MNQLLHEPELRAIFADAVVEPRLRITESILQAGVANGEIDAATLTPYTARVGPALINQQLLLTGAPPNKRQLAHIVDTVVAPAGAGAYCGVLTHCPASPTIPTGTEPERLTLCTLGPAATIVVSCRIGSTVDMFHSRGSTALTTSLMFVGTRQRRIDIRLDAVIADAGQVGRRLDQRAGFLGPTRRVRGGRGRRGGRSRPGRHRWVG